MINRILSTAVKFFLRSQVERVEDLQLQIEGKNRQILQGYIPQIFLSCDRLIYQGLNLQQVEAKGANIGFNLAEVLQQKPFRLLEPITIEVKFSLSSADLQASLSSPLLQAGLSDLWGMVTADQNQNISTVNWQQLAIAPEQLSLSGTYGNNFDCDSFDFDNSDYDSQIQTLNLPELDLLELNLQMGIALTDHHTLDLSPVKIYWANSGIEELQKGVQIDLGADVAIERLRIESEQFYCSGSIVINN